MGRSTVRTLNGSLHTRVMRWSYPICLQLSLPGFRHPVGCPCRGEPGHDLEIGHTGPIQGHAYLHRYHIHCRAAGIGWRHDDPPSAFSIFHGDPIDTPYDTKIQYREYRQFWITDGIQQMEYVTFTDHFTHWKSLVILFPASCHDIGMKTGKWKSMVEFLLTNLIGPVNVSSRPVSGKVGSIGA